MPVKFIHIRKHDDQGKILPKGGGTVAYYVEADPDQDSSDVVVAAFSYCNPKDHYSKVHGRNRSAGLLTSERRSHIFAYPQSGTVVQFLIEQWKEYAPQAVSM